MQRFTISIALAALLSIASAASADVLRVPQDFPTIQAAVNAADPGDRIRIANGTFIENVLVPFGLDGLIVEGSGKTIVDARPLGAAGSGAAIQVAADAVIIRRLTVRHGKGLPGPGVQIIGDDAVIDRVTAIHCADQAFSVAGARARVERCTAIACEFGVAVAGADAIVRKSTVRGCDVGVYVIGANAAVESNKVVRSAGTGIFVSGLHASVRKCLVDGAHDNGIVVNSAALTAIADNVVRGVSVDTAIVVIATLGGVVERNRVLDVGAAGIACVGGASGVLVSKNTVERTGHAYPGFLVASPNNAFVANIARTCGGDGYLDAGGFTTWMGNRALSNAEDGFDLVAASATLTDNIVLGNGAEGIDNVVAGVVCTGNVVRKNRIDVANAGAFATFEDNIYDTGGLAVLPQIDL